MSNMATLLSPVKTSTWETDGTKIRDFAFEQHTVSCKNAIYLKSKADGSTNASTKPQSISNLESRLKQIRSTLESSKFDRHAGPDLLFKSGDVLLAERWTHDNGNGYPNGFRPQIATSTVIDAKDDWHLKQRIENSQKKTYQGLWSEEEQLGSNPNIKKTSTGMPYSNACGLSCEYAALVNEKNDLLKQLQSLKSGSTQPQN